jgi:hypothetical protein
MGNLYLKPKPSQTILKCRLDLMFIKHISFNLPIWAVTQQVTLKCLRTLQTWDNGTIYWFWISTNFRKKCVIKIIVNHVNAGHYFHRPPIHVPPAGLSGGWWKNMFSTGHPVFPPATQSFHWTVYQVAGGKHVFHWPPRISGGNSGWPVETKTVIFHYIIQVLFGLGG